MPGEADLAVAVARRSAEAAGMVRASAGRFCPDDARRLWPTLMAEADASAAAFNLAFELMQMCGDP